jgi:hypothetical protein
VRLSEVELDVIQVEYIREGSTRSGSARSSDSLHSSSYKALKENRRDFWAEVKRRAEQSSPSCPHSYGRCEVDIYPHISQSRCSNCLQFRHISGLVKEVREEFG